MLLRRITQHVRDQNWIAIVLDFVIVVAGVFVGIQVANWNAERLEARQGELFTERLITDLRTEYQNWNMLVAYLRDVQSNADKAIAILEGAADASDEQLLIHAYRATQYIFTVRWRATFEELTSTGSLGLIKDQGLRNAAVQFYTWPGIEDAIDEGSTSLYRKAFRGILPIEVQGALTQHCGDRLSYSGSVGQPQVELEYECATDLTSAQIAYAASSLRTNPELLPLLRLRAMNLRTSISNLTDAALGISEGLRPIVAADLDTISAVLAEDALLITGTDSDFFSGELQE